nr:MAG TPA: hypothetical protein [Caudoviricetes sp.]
MIRIIESIDNDIENKMTLELKENDSKVDVDLINDWFSTTLAGLDDNIIFDDINYDDLNNVTANYYYYSDNDDNIYLGEWDINYNDMINMSDVDRVKILDNISAEVEASASGIIDDNLDN